LDEKYPFGATTVEEQERLKKIVETFPPEERPFVSFGPGIHAEKPLSETGFPDDNE
jgi:hypothetical protein